MSIFETIQEMGEDNWLEQDEENRGWCEICGEPYDMVGPWPSHREVGEFVRENPTPSEDNPDRVVHVIAHAQCGLDAGLELA